MLYTLTILQEHYRTLRDTTLAVAGTEGAAYLVCGISVSPAETRYLVREVIPVRDEHYLRREPNALSIDSASYAAAAKRAAQQKAALIFVHSHPGGYAQYSEQDDQEEPLLMEFFKARIADKTHGSAVVIGNGDLIGRVCTEAGWQSIERVRVVGDRFQFFDQVEPHEAGREPVPEFFDRQVRAFGPDIQRLLSRLHVGVVGAGGTGSATLAELARLGVGTLSIFDGDAFATSNVNRVYGSTTDDAGQNKATIAKRQIDRIGLGTHVTAYADHITNQEVAKQLRECDLVFNCTDRQLPRAILTQLSLRYLIPVIDTAVVIASENQTIKGIYGRVTTLLPGTACLLCRERITPKAIREETLGDAERAALAQEGYAAELETPAPAVIPFTTAVAAQAVAELLHRLTGFMGADRNSSEVLLFLDKTEFKRNRATPGSDCICQQKSIWGKGDARDFLGMAWSSATGKEKQNG